MIIYVCRCFSLDGVGLTLVIFPTEVRRKFIILLLCKRNLSTNGGSQLVIVRTNGWVTSFLIGRRRS